MNKFSSLKYWESRYSTGGNSGAGSQGHLLHFKTQVIQDFINMKGICSVIDLGCGDGKLARQLKCDTYMGYDVSITAVDQCRQACPFGLGKHFYMMDEWCGESADLSMSVDVLFHLVEDQVFSEYMERLFSVADHHVLVYSSNNTNNEGMSPHVRHRKFTDWVEENKQDWRLDGHTRNQFSFYDGDPQGSYCDFYFFTKKGGE